MKRYRRRPFEVEAAQLPPLTEDGAHARWEEIRAWCSGHWRGHAPGVLLIAPREKDMFTREPISAVARDWIVRDAGEEFHKFSDAEFVSEYEAMPEPDEGDKGGTP